MYVCSTKRQSLESHDSPLVCLQGHQCTGSTGLLTTRRRVETQTEKHEIFRCICLGQSSRIEAGLDNNMTRCNSSMPHPRVVHSLEYIRSGSSHRAAWLLQHGQDHLTDRWMEGLRLFSDEFLQLTAYCLLLGQLLIWSSNACHDMHAWKQEE